MLECTDPLEISTVNGITDFTLYQDVIYDNFNDITNPKNGYIYQIKAYGLKSNATLEDHKILLVTEDLTEHIVVTPDNIYTLLLEQIEDDDKLQFVYYYGCWYKLDKAYEKTKLLKGDIRQLRDNEYILINDEKYDDFSEIKNPIPNGVYWISSYVVNDAISFNINSGLLTVTKNDVLEKANNDYTLLVERLYSESKNRFIYYHGEWYPFTDTHDVLCPVEGLVNYYCEIMKGVY